MSNERRAKYSKANRSTRLVARSSQLVAFFLNFTESLLR